MKQAFTPESLFRVSTLGVRDSGDDVHVTPGAHLRAWVNPAIGFPLRGLTFIPLRRDALDPGQQILVRPLTMLWWLYDDDGAPRPLGSDPEMMIRPDRPLYGDIVGLEKAVGDKEPWISWVRLDVDEFSPVQMSVIGRTGGPEDRTLVSRSRAPFALAASRIRRIRLTGEGLVRNVIGMDSSLASREFIDPDPANRIHWALPLTAATPWADPVIGRDGGMDRVTRGAPIHTGPHEVPTDFDTNGQDERARVEALLDRMETTSVAPLLESAYSDPGSLPTRHRTPLIFDGEKQQAKGELGSVETLITAAADPGIARWLGLASPADADLGGDSVPVGWIAVGVWAADPAARVSAGTPPTTVADMAMTIGTAGPTQATLAAWRALAGGTPVDQNLLTALGLTQLPLVTPAVIGSLPDLPGAPTLAADGQGRWIAQDRYQQDIAVLGPPRGGPVAFTRSVAGDTASQHAFIAVNATPRALTMLPGRREQVTGCQGTLTDTSVPAGTGPVIWRVAEGDEFGRWGPSGVLNAVPPQRPPLPEPRPEAHFFADYTLRDAPPGPLSPGTVTVEVDVPPPDALGPGTSPITEVYVIDPPVHAPFPDNRVRVSFPAAATAVGEVRDQCVTVTFKSDDSEQSATVSVRLVDPRRPEPIPTAPRLLWSSRRDPVGTAEIDLSWPTAPNHAAYNVYLADEQVVTTQLNFFPDSHNRATRAAALHSHQHRPMQREAFTLLTPVPLTAGGRVRFAHRIPGSLQTLQYVRVVPLTAAQVEADFDACGLTPVAVPGADQPPAPAVLVGDRDGELTVHVEAHGINTHVVDRLQAAGTAAPEYRVRGATATTSHIYGAKIDEGHLVPVDGGPDTYRVAVPSEKLAALPAFVPLSVTAQVRYPPEVSTEPGAQPLPSLIVTTAGLTDAQPGEWSAPSTPVSVMLTAPTPPLTASVQRNGNGVDVTFAALPAVHAHQVAPWRLQLWRETSDGEVHWLTDSDADLTVDPLTPTGLDGWELTSTELHIRDAHADVVRYVATLMNPLGEAAPLTDLQVID